jgi:hypothetical protein
MLVFMVYPPDVDEFKECSRKMSLRAYPKIRGVLNLLRENDPEQVRDSNFGIGSKESGATVVPQRPRLKQSHHLVLAKLKSFELRFALAPALKRLETSLVCEV